MANLKGVDIQKGKIGANRLSNEDSVSGLVISSVAPTGLELDTPTTVYNMRDVQDLGITSGFDKDNSVNVYRHFSEFYRMAGEGRPLHFMLVSQSTTMVAITETNAKKLLAHARGEIRQLAIAVNPTDAPTLLNGMPSDVYNAIANAQALYNWSYENHMPCQIVLEGYAYGGSAASTANLRDLDNDLQADKVSIIIGQDWLYADKLQGQRQKYADVGTALGVLSRAKVQENIGDNGQFNLTDATLGEWVEPGLSSHQKNTEVFESLQTLEDKGYIFGVVYSGLAGVRWNNDHTSTPIIIDADGSMNEHTISYGRLKDKAVRELRRAYLPKVKTTWTVDKKTGKLSKGTLIALEDIGDDVFEDMISRGEITHGKTYIDANSDLLVERVLRANYKIIPKGTIGEIKGNIDLKTRT